MKFGELVEHTIECIKTFNPVYKTIDSHSDEFLANVFLPWSCLTKSLVQRSLWESFHKASFLRMYTLRRIPQNLLQSFLWDALFNNQSQRYSSLQYLRLPFILQTWRAPNCWLQKADNLIGADQDECVYVVRVWQRQAERTHEGTLDGGLRFYLHRR